MSIRHSLMAAALTVGMVGCDGAQYDRTDLFAVAGDPQANIEPGRIFVPRGGVMVFEAHLVSTSDSLPYKGWETLELRSTQNNVAEVRQAIMSDSWVINGKQAGSGSILVEVDGDHVDSLRFEVQEVVR